MRRYQSLIEESLGTKRYVFLNREVPYVAGATLRTAAGFCGREAGSKNKEAFLFKRSALLRPAPLAERITSGLFPGFPRGP